MRDLLFKKLGQLADGKKKPISEADFSLLMKEKLVEAGLSLELTVEEEALKNKCGTNEFGLLIKGTALKGDAKTKYDSLSIEEKASLGEAIKKQKNLNSRGSEIAPIKKTLNDKYVVFSPPEFQQAKTNQLYLVLPIAAEGTEISPRGTLEQFVTGEKPGSLSIKDIAASDRPLAFLVLQNGRR